MKEPLEQEKLNQTIGAGIESQVEQIIFQYVNDAPNKSEVIHNLKSKGFLTIEQAELLAKTPAKTLQIPSEIIRGALGCQPT